MHEIPQCFSSMIKVQKTKSGLSYPEVTISNTLVCEDLKAFSSLYQFITSYSYKKFIKNSL